MNKTSMKDTRRYKLIAQGLSRVLCILILVIIVLTVMLSVQSGKVKEAESRADEMAYIIAQASLDNINVNEPEPTTAPTEAAVIEPTHIEYHGQYIGEFTITYYCSCEKCCGEYGKNRPKVNGKEVVVTSTGAYAQDGITIAVDPNVIPYGSWVYIEGIGYRIAQDCGGGVKGNHIDVYVSNHDKANELGRHQAQVYLLQGGNNND